MGFRGFSLRGKENVSGEWTLVCLAYNLKRLRRMTESTGNGAGGPKSPSMHTNVDPNDTRASTEEGPLRRIIDTISRSLPRSGRRIHRKTCANSDTLLAAVISRFWIVQNNEY